MGWALLLALVGCAHRDPRPVPVAQPAPVGFTAPSDARAWYLEAVVAEQRGDLEAAERALAWVARLDRSSPWPWVAAGELARRRGDLDGAIAAFERARSIARIPEAALALGMARLVAGDPEAAGPLLAEAADAGLDAAVAPLARIALAAGDTQGARDRLAAWHPGDPADRRTRATLLDPIDPAAAVDAWLAVVDADDPPLDDLRSLVAAARAACRAHDAAAWFAARHVASWGKDEAALAAELARRIPGCATDAEP